MASNTSTPVQSATALGRALRDRRRTRALTQQQLSELAGVPQATISRAERGVASLTFPTLLRILAALELELVLQPRVPRDAASVWTGD